MQIITDWLKKFKTHNSANIDSRGAARYESFINNNKNK